RRPRAQPEPARDRAADGPALGRDPRVVGAGRRDDQAGSRHGGRRMTTRVTVWNEFRQERSDPAVRAVYRDGIHAAIADGLRASGADVEVRTATLDEPEHGLTEAVLADTDVLAWWGHAAHDEVAGLVVDRVHARVLDGMGLV